MKLRLILPFALFLFTFSLLQGCGLSWTLPQAHFEGVDEQGHVAYWEKIGQADLGDDLIIPVHIGFNSSRESSSPTLGKGWILPLLESHIEPVDENTMHVIMPDGWTFLFLRNGNTQTWRGNAGWVGETDGARFTATAPCGWRIKFDAGKIQEIDTPRNRTITVKYNGPAPLEADIDNQPFVQVAQNTATGVAESITIGGQKIAISQAQRPRISTILGKTLLTGFDPALSQLQWPNGNKETFNFATGHNLTPTLVVSRLDVPNRCYTWNPTTSSIIGDGIWKYTITGGNNGASNVQISRQNPLGQREFWFDDRIMGQRITQNINGVKYLESYFPAGPLRGKIRKVVKIQDGVTSIIRELSYDEKGRVMRDMIADLGTITFTWDDANAAHTQIIKYKNGVVQTIIWKDGKKVSNTKLINGVVVNATNQGTM